MTESAHPSERPVGDYLLFALAFLGFGLGAGGVVLVSPFLALSGLLVLLFALICFNGTADD